MSEREQVLAKLECFFKYGCRSQWSLVHSIRDTIQGHQYNAEQILNWLISERKVIVKFEEGQAWVHLVRPE